MLNYSKSINTKFSIIDFLSRWYIQLPLCFKGLINICGHCITNSIFWSTDVLQACLCETQSSSRRDKSDNRYERVALRRRKLSV